MSPRPRALECGEVSPHNPSSRRVRARWPAKWRKRYCALAPVSPDRWWKRPKVGARWGFATMRPRSCRQLEPLAGSH